MNQVKMTEGELYKLIHKEVSSYFDDSTNYASEMASSLCDRLAPQLGITSTQVDCSALEEPKLPGALNDAPIAITFKGARDFQESPGFPQDASDGDYFVVARSSSWPTDASIALYAGEYLVYWQGLWRHGPDVERAVARAFQKPRNLSRYGQICYELGCRTQSQLTGMKVDPSWKIVRLPDTSITVEHPLVGKWTVCPDTNAVAHMFFDELLAQNTTHEATHQGNIDMARVVTTAEHLSSLQALQRASNELTTIQKNVGAAVDKLTEHIINLLLQQK